MGRCLGGESTGPDGGVASWARSRQPTAAPEAWKHEAGEIELTNFELKKWSQIMGLLPARVGKQCRERWFNPLRPNIKLCFASTSSRGTPCLQIRASRSLGLPCSCRLFEEKNTERLIWDLFHLHRGSVPSSRFV